MRDRRYSSVARRGVNANDALSEDFSSDEGKVPLSHLVQLYDKSPSQCCSLDSDNLNLNSLETEMSNLFKCLSIVKINSPTGRLRYTHTFFVLYGSQRGAIPRYLGNGGLYSYDIVFLYKVVHHPVYFKLRSELTAMESYADNLSVCTLEKITYVWLVKTMKWIEAVSSAVYVPNAGSLLTKLCIPFNDAMRLIHEGHKIFFRLTDESKKYMLKYRLSVVTRSSTGKVFVKNCKGGSNHSAGGTVLRWISFCYSGLRNDLASTTYWMRRAEMFLDNKTIETDLFKSSSELAEETEESLVVAPKMELLEKIANVLKENSPAPKKATFAVDGKPEFIHNLLMNNDTTKDDASDNEYPGDNKAAGPTDDSNS